MMIGDFDTAARVLVVAEVGNNHEGSFELAAKLVEEAAACGADAVKFQTFRTEHYVSRSDATRFAWLKSFELSIAQFTELSHLSKRRGLMFISTPFDLMSAAALEPIVDAYKIASGDNTFYPLLDQVSRTNRPLVVSTGLSDEENVRRLVAFVRERRPPGQGLALLHCVSTYPVSLEEANLQAIRTLERISNCVVGYSDHTLGIEACLVAAGVGARIIEKHFTLDKASSDFRDHQLSADPADLRRLVDGVRRVSSLLGSGQKIIQASETYGLSAFRRSIAAGGDLPKGHRISFEDLTWLRPGGGAPCGTEDQFLGRVLRRSVTFGELLRSEDLEEPRS